MASAISRFMKKAKRRAKKLAKRARKVSLDPRTRAKAAKASTGRNRRSH
jgi:hypothetical protein